MALTVSITEQQVYKAIGDFVQSVLLAGLPVIQLPVNRTAMPPPSPGFVGMRASLQSRIMTNIDSWDLAAVNPAAIDIMQAVRVSMMLECYGPTAWDWAVILSTVLRDEYGITALAPSGVAPLYADDPRFAPLVAGEEQYENRWLVNAVLQYNPVISTPMQFADTAEAGIINVDVEYPPS